MLCDSANYIVEPSVCIEASESKYSKMPSNKALESSSPSLIDPDLNPSFVHYHTSTSSEYGINRSKASKHPNIQHHPTIHPHSRYQRTLLNTLNRNTPLISENSSHSNNLNDCGQYQERKEIEENIRCIQGTINELNDEIFKDHSNYQRPPSEYLEVYNELTQRLHYFQEKKQNLELLLNTTRESEGDEDCTSNTPPSRDSSDTDEQNQRIPTLKLDNSPKSLQAKHSHTPTSPGSPMAPIFPLSPTNAQSDAFTLSQSNSSVSLPTSVTNPNISSMQLATANPLSQNSRSFVEIIDTSQPNSSHNNTTNNSAPFLRIYIGSSTAVVEKKPVALRDIVSSKLKNRNMEIKKCIAYIKDTNLKLDWSVEVNKIKADSICVAEISDEIRHSFEKKTLTLRSCDSCKKRTLLNVYACSKCLYVMCRRDECRTKSEQFICAPRKLNSFNSLVGSMNVLPKSDFDYFGRSESPLPDLAISNISQQILPVNQLKVSIPSRDRSRSETELNIYVNPKLTIENNRPVPKSPSSMCKLTAGNNIYNTMPRSQYIKSNSSNIDGISGSVNRESGSVLSSMYAKSLSSEPKIEVKTSRPKQNKPNRRDSFNSWEIPFKQINIDMNKKVGSGSFGIVHQGCDFYHGTVAVKFLNVQNPTPNQSNAFRNEVAILKSTRHDNVLLFIGCILKPYMAIVTEWCPGSSLYRHLHVEEEQWDHTQLIDIAKQTSIGMEYLHARDILHRDLKSNNIFLIPKESNPRLNNFPVNYDFLSEQESQKWTVKIGDFGLATVKSTWTPNTVRTNQPTGSILWMAPEVIKQKVTDPYTQKSDVYSYSVVLYELFSGQLPYQHKEQNMILFLVGSGRLKPNPDDCKPDTPQEIKELIKVCSEYERDNRLDFVQINEKFGSIKMSKLKMGRIQRAKSVPNVSFSQVVSHMSVMYDEDLYPITPQLELKQKNNLPIFNNFNLNETSQLITNL